MSISKNIITVQPPPYSMDILNPPAFQGPQGMLICYNPLSAALDGKYGIFGTDSQTLQVTLNPGEVMQSQPGTLQHKAESIIMKTTSKGGFKRLMGGQNIFQNNWINQGSELASIAISPVYPAKIIAIDLSRCGGAITLHPGSYLAQLGNVHLTYKFVRNLGAACFGGSGMLLLKVTGDGVVFVTGGGTVMEKVLAPGEKLHINSEGLVGFAESCNYDVVLIPGCLNCCCGGEGMFNTQITGPGLVIVESMAFDRLRRLLGGASGGSGSSGDNGVGQSS